MSKFEYWCPVDPITEELRKSNDGDDFYQIVTILCLTGPIYAGWFIDREIGVDGEFGEFVIRELIY